MRRRVMGVLVLLGLASGCFGQAYRKPVAKLELGADEVLVFLGDSITHQCLYTQYVEDYFYTRYPQTRVRFHNAGVSGDKAADALVRFEEDVAKLKPKYVTILLGMNDGRYTRFEQDIFDTYEKDMSALLEKIEGIGAKAVVMTPTMFDMRARRIRAEGKSKEQERLQNVVYYNGVLAFYGAWLREQAHQKGLGFVDMYSPLNNLTLAERKEEAKFTIIKDAVHPGPAGQLVMAAALLQDMAAPGVVSEINIWQNEYKEWQLRAKGGELYEGWEQGAGRGGFMFLADSLPWVVPEEARQGYRLTRSGKRLSREVLRVSSLEPGKYEVLINGAVVGTYSELELSRGVELQENSKTPQYQQALQVALLNKERNEKAVRPLRNQWSQLKGKRNKGIPKSQPEAFKKWYGEFEKKVAELQKLAKEYEDKIYKINKPQPRSYEIKQID